MKVTVLHTLQNGLLIYNSSSLSLRGAIKHKFSLFQEKEKVFYSPWQKTKNLNFMLCFRVKNTRAFPEISP
jgi:hypothetical protein